MTEIIPLGTGSAVPVRNRGFSSVALRRPESVLLFDCGEGTQLKILETDIKMSRVDSILISHLHGDHFFGLMGLMATMSLLHRQAALTVAGPAGIRDRVESMPGLTPEEMTYDVNFVEMEETRGRVKVVAGRGWRVWAELLDHGVPCFGFRYQEDDVPGKLDADSARRLGVQDPLDFGRLKSGGTVHLDNGIVVRPEEVLGQGKRGASFAYVTDTRPCDTAIDLSRNADILYHEATFAHDLAERASATGHSTAREAAEIAAEAGAGRLLLSHFSARYRTFDHLVAEARAIFPATEAAEELTRYTLESVTQTSEST